MTVNVSENSHDILRLLHKGPICGIPSFKKTISITREAMYVRIKILQNMGLVRSRPRSTKSTLKRVYSLTDNGKKFLEMFPWQKMEKVIKMELKGKLICLLIGHSWAGGTFCISDSDEDNKYDKRFCGRCCSERVFVDWPKSKNVLLIMWMMMIIGIFVL